jgi:hypothetical protein
MGDTYTRQSSGNITSGATIEASHFNDEFDQLVSAFAASSGHTHDGTTAEGGPITKLLGNTLTFGAGTAGTDITITFDGETSDGVLKWMEDEDYFEFSDDILVASTEKLQFRDTAIYINSSTDGQLDLVADSEVQIAATTIDINGNVDVSGTLTVAGAVDFGDAALSNVGAVQLDSIAGDGDTNTSITFSGSDVITITAGGDAQFTFNNGSILPSTDNDIDLGSSSLEFKDAFFDGTVTTDALVADTADIDAGTIDGVTLGTNSAITQAVIDDVDINGKVITMTGSSSDTAVFTAGTNGTLSIVTTDDSAAAANITITADGTFEADGTTITLDSSGDIVLDADGANVTFKDGGTSILDIANNSTDVEFTVSTADKNFKIKGTDGSSAITALDIDMALAGKATFNGDVVVGGDLTVTGDDIVMGTNTAGNLLVADGTNFNSIAVGDLSAITSVAADDVLIAVDTSGGGLKKITRSALVSGLAAGTMSDIIDDTSPQLGGDLDTNSFNIAFDDAHGINDENGNEQIIFQTTASAVNQFDITNAATGNAPELSATGGDTNISLKITPKGSGQVLLDGNVGIESGVIDLKNAGSQSYIRFYCESSNAHYAQLQAPAHSDFAGNTTLTLPATTDTLVGRATTDTLTNKTLTTPVIAEIDSGSTITLDATTDIVLDADGGDIFLKDGGTTFGEFTNSSTDFVIKSTTSDKDIIIKGNDGGSEITALTLDMSAAGAATFNDKIIATELDISGDVDIDGTLETDALSIASTTVTSTAAELNILDGVTATASELNILDGVTSTAAELNIMDGDTAASSVTLVDADRLVTNDAGTMKQVALTTLKTYLTSAGFSSEDPTALAIALG